VTVQGVSTFERFYRRAAGIDVDKDDLKRHVEFVNHNLHDLLLIAEARAGRDGRDVVEPGDLPITKGLQETIHDFRRLDADVGLTPHIGHIAALPQLDRSPNDAVVAFLPEVAGGLSLALARTFTILEPDLTNPSSEHWDRAFRIFDLLL
jgi:hypothetical protein